MQQSYETINVPFAEGRHYEVIAQHLGFDAFVIKSGFEESVDGPSRAMIKAIVVRHPELTVEKFARVVEEKAYRKDVAHLLRAYGRDSMKGTNITAMSSC